MDDLKRKSIAALCKFGKFGVGKSLTFGMYEFGVPKELMRTEEDSDFKQEKLHKEI